MKTFDVFIFFICLWSLAGVFGVEVKSVSVTEGVSVTLPVKLTQIQENEEIEWKFEDILIADINRKDNNITYYNNAADGRFRDILKLDTQSGSLTIMNTTTKHTGLYKVTRDHWTSVNNTFSLTVNSHQQSNDILLLSAAAAVVVGCLLIAAAIWVFCRKIRTSHQEVKTHAEEITYAEPTFYRTKAQKSSVQVEPDVVYAGVTVRR
ncbi:uncharacterized protein isoform X2 [Danio rerio]|uniref:Uncharacterized protein isoform X2 n=1 Tax=Danio rerio TaxID=7955 RepID=A0AC58IGJ4_DANRE